MRRQDRWIVDGQSNHATVRMVLECFVLRAQYVELELELELGLEYVARLVVRHPQQARQEALQRIAVFHLADCYAPY